MRSMFLLMFLVACARPFVKVDEYGDRRVISPTHTMTITIPVLEDGDGPTFIMEKEMNAGYVEVFDPTTQMMIRVEIRIEENIVTVTMPERILKGKVFWCYRDPFSPAYVMWDGLQFGKASTLARYVCYVIGDDNNRVKTNNDP